MAHIREQAPRFACRIGLRRQAPGEHDLRVLEFRKLPLELVRRPEVISFENGNILPTRHSESQVVPVSKTRDPSVALSDIAYACVREVADYFSRSVS